MKNLVRLLHEEEIKTSLQIITYDSKTEMSTTYALSVLHNDHLTFTKKVKLQQQNSLSK